MSIHRISFVIAGNEAAVRRSVRRMLDNHGLTELAFELQAPTASEIDAHYRPFVAVPGDRGDR